MGKESTDMSMRRQSDTKTKRTRNAKPSRSISLLLRKEPNKIGERNGCRTKKHANN